MLYICIVAIFRSVECRELRKYNNIWT